MRSFVLLIENDPLIARILRKVIKERCPGVKEVLVIKNGDSIDRIYSMYGSRIQAIVMTCCHNPQCCEIINIAEYLQRAQFSGKIIDLSKVAPTRISLSNTAIGDLLKVMPVVKILNDLTP